MIVFGFTVTFLFSSTNCVFFVGWFVLWLFVWLVISRDLSKYFVCIVFFLMFLRIRLFKLYVVLWVVIIYVFGKFTCIVSVLWVGILVMNVWGDFVIDDGGVI